MCLCGLLERERSRGRQHDPAASTVRLHSIGRDADDCVSLSSCLSLSLCGSYASIHRFLNVYLERRSTRQFQREETTPTASSGKLASLLSIIKKQKERQHENPAGNVPPQPPLSILGDAPQSRGSDALLGSPPRSERIRSPLSRPPHASDSSGYSHPHHHPSVIRSAYSSDERSRGGALLPEPPASAAIGRRFRPASDDSTEWHDDSRDVKKPRGSRWGPPKALASDDFRPPPINTLPPATRFAPSNALPQSSSSSAAAYSPPGAGRHDTMMGAPPPPSLGGGPDKTPREICRNFIAGRCTFGDRCWYVCGNKRTLSCVRGGGSLLSFTSTGRLADYRSRCGMD